MCSCAWCRKRWPATGLKCPTASPGTATDLIQVMWFCSVKIGRSRTISSNGSHGWLGEPDTLRKNEPSGRITLDRARATSTIHAR